MSGQYTGVDGVVYDTDTGATAPAWWQGLITTVVTAAVNKNTAGLQSGQSYHLDPATNRLVADGAYAGNVAAAVQSNPLVMFGLLAVGAVLLYKLVK